MVVFDDDNFYLGGVIAEKLHSGGLDVTLVTTHPTVSSWTANTLEQHRIQSHILELGIDVVASHNLVRIEASEIELACLYSDRRSTVPAASLVMVTSRQPNNQLYLDLIEDPAALRAAGIDSVQEIGDCDVPATIAVAVYDGHRVARELDAPPPDDPDMPFRREHIALSA